MTDKISGAGTGYPTSTSVGRASARGAAAPSAAPAAPAGGGADAVSLTGDAELMRALDSRIADAPAVNRALVEQVRTALANGEYQVNGERIAEKLLAAEGGLGALLGGN